MSELQADDRWAVVVNHEEQYSVWHLSTAVPDGWREVGFTSTREACLDHIEVIWTDMRPLSVRRALGDAGGNEA